MIGRRHLIFGIPIGLSIVSISTNILMANESDDFAEFIRLSKLITGRAELDERVGETVYNYLLSDKPGTFELFISEFSSVKTVTEFSIKEKTTSEDIQILIKTSLRIWYSGWVIPNEFLSIEDKAYAYEKALVWQINGSSAKGLPGRALWNAG